VDVHSDFTLALHTGINASYGRNQLQHSVKFGLHYQLRDRDFQSPGVIYYERAAQGLGAHGEFVEHASEIAPHSSAL